MDKINKSLWISMAVIGMEAITENITKLLITSIMQESIINGVNYTSLFNGIFFMLTAVGAIGLIAQTIPMLFF